ncbi:uncharacterized protein LOC110187604 [Drosophila serrata]|uniref:uncharacterized protein LOC110187604 n=1 Tax=Drosophila serrata TaxID=7274 RepID=UPI000A1CF3AB|nr:uncharacterized protein LOC110187604 [Drosophila serrata]
MPTVRQPRKRRIAPQPPPKPSPKPRKMRGARLQNDQNDHCAFIEQLFATTNEATTLRAISTVGETSAQAEIITAFTVVADDLVSLDYTDSLEYQNCSSDDCCYASNDTLTHGSQRQQQQLPHHHHHHHQDHHHHSSGNCHHPVDEELIEAKSSPLPPLNATKVQPPSKRDRPLSEISVTSVDTPSPSTAKAS